MATQHLGLDCSNENTNRIITILDLEMAGFLLLWLVIEYFCPTLIALFSNNSPTLHWMQQLAVKHSLIAMQLVWALALWLLLLQAPPLTLLHIAEMDNAMMDILSWLVGSEPKWYCKTDTAFLTLLQFYVPVIKSDLMDHLLPFLCHHYKSDFYLAYEAFYSRQMEATAKSRHKYWTRWIAYAAPLGLDPYLHKIYYKHQAKVLFSFASCIRLGYYGHGKQVQVGAVNCTILVIGMMLSLAKGISPTRMENTVRLIPHPAQMMQGRQKADPPTLKTFSVEANVPKLLSKVGWLPTPIKLDTSIGDLALIAFYYLLHVDKYTIKSTRNNSNKQSDCASRISPSSNMTQLEIYNN
jgi:hypothetical protein